MRIRPNYNGAGNLGIFLEEEKSRDTEIGHVYEAMSFVIFDNSGNILGTANTDNDNARNAISIRAEKQNIQKSKQTDFNIYPNPNDGNFEYNFTGDITTIENSEIRIFNSEGRLIHQQQIINLSGKIQLKLNNGFYVIQLVNEIETKTQSLLIQN